MRKVFITIATVSLVLGGAWLYVFDPRGPWTNRWCTIGVMDEAVSPGGTVTARAVDFGCGIIAPGYWSAVVIVKKGKAPSKQDEVLVGDISRDEIKLRWTAPDRLEIALTPVSRIAESKPEHVGVKIDIVRRLQP